MYNKSEDSLRTAAILKAKAVEEIIPKTDSGD